MYYIIIFGVVNKINSNINVHVTKLYLIILITLQLCSVMVGTDIYQLSCDHMETGMHFHIYMCKHT